MPSSPQKTTVFLGADDVKTIESGLGGDARGVAGEAKAVLYPCNGSNFTTDSRREVL